MTRDVPETNPVILLEGITKRFGDGPAVLQDFNLRAEAGEFISLIGPSGCGKSTVLRLVCGLIKPTAGTLTVDGREPADARERMSFIFQEATLLPWLNVERNIQVPMRIRGTPVDVRRAMTDRMLRLVRLEAARRSYPRELSGGMKMRVSIARALAIEPRVLLLDEPFGALDEMTRDHLNEELLALRSEMAFTALFVTHSVPEAVFLSTRILVLAATPGRIHREIAVPLPYPRNDDTRQSRDYQDLVVETSRALRSVERLGMEARAA